MINRKNRILGVMLSLCMTASAVPAVYATDSAPGAAGGSDIDGHWAKAAMQEFIDAGYLKGSGGKYLPDAQMNRAQFAAVVNRLMSYSSESADISKFTDVKDGSWYKADLAKALAAGYMSGTAADIMSPEAPITREQAFVILARILKLSSTDSEAEQALAAYKDAGSVSAWARNSVAAMIKAGYVSGDNNGNINPKKSLTRAEGVTVLNRSRKSADQKPNVTGKYTDGVYTGTGAGYGGTMKLQVTIKDGKISDIKILSESETGSYLNRAKSIIQKIIDNNGTDGVSAVSGATKTSNGIFDAVKACLSQAQGGKDTSTTGSTGGGHGGSGNATKPADDDQDGNWKDGTYTGTAQGYSYQGVTATVTVADGKITEIVLKNNGETSSYYADATGKTSSGKTIIEEIISGQTTNKINAVSGATKTSYAIVNAVKNALKQAVKEQIPGDDPTAPLNDGVWYGTSTEGYRFMTSGPNILKVTVEKGLIKDVSTVKFADDNGGFREKAERLFVKAEGKSSVEELRNQITERSGECYDVVSGATFSGMSYVTAMENALARSRAGGEQKIAWMEVAEKPSIAYFDEKFDLSSVVLNVYLNNDPTTPVKVKGTEISDYDITAELDDGTAVTDGRVITKDDVDSSSTFRIGFKEKISRAAAYMNVYTRVHTNQREATHVKVTYANEREEIINMSSDEFRYVLTPVSRVTSMELYEGDTKLADGEYYEAGNSWSFDLSKVDPGEGNSWRFTTYRVDVGAIKDDSAVKSFTLTTPESSEYQPGQKLDMSGVTVNAITENDNMLRLSWSEALRRGFKCDPENGYEFTEGDIGTKTITVSIDGAEPQTFSVTVSAVPDTDPQVPETVRLMDGDTVVYEFSGLTDTWIEKDGRLTYTNPPIVLPVKYTDWTQDTFTVTAVNKAGKELTAEVAKSGRMMKINLPEYGEYGGYIMFIPQFEQKEISQIPAKVDIRLAGSESEAPLASIQLKSEEMAGVKEFGDPILKWADIKSLVPSDWTAETFDIKAYNADNDELKVTVKKQGIMLIVTFTDFITDPGTPGAIKIAMR